MKDPYIDTNAIVDRLIAEYNKYGKLIIAYDFDGTVFDFHAQGVKYPRVISLLQSLRPYANFIVYSASNPVRYPFIREYLKDNNIPYNTINNPIENMNVPNGYKLYYNILLDDRAGLGQTVEALEIFLDKIKSPSK